STPDLPISSDALLDALTSSGRKYGLLSAPTANVKNAIIFGFDDLTVMVRQPTPGSKKRTPPTVKPTNEIAG
ncbi:MAG TPA: hypothetical protein VNH18_01440, partial [Bryobacteraceae bacterium]|nr:hypothetical protein [Bryobacteraceae bacterium]